jgi:transcription elongation factor Elf1
MGRRKKAAKKVVKKKRALVSKVFKCLFCSHEKSIVSKIDLKNRTGELECIVCGAKFQSKVNTLTEPIDLYHEWLDKAREKQAEENRSAGVQRDYPEDFHDVDEQDDEEEANAT